MFLASNLKKPKENHCFWLRTLKNLRKIIVFDTREAAERQQRDTREAAERQQDTREAAKRFCVRSTEVDQIWDSLWGIVWT